MEPLGNSFGAITYMKLHEDVVLILVDSRKTNSKPIGDFFVEQTLGQTVEDLVLSPGEPKGGVCPRFSRPPRDVFRRSPRCN